MSRSGRHPEQGFTLLESIIALAMIGAVAGACLQLRAQSLAGRQRLSVRQTTDRSVETVFRLAQSGLLEGGISDKDEQGLVVRTTWTGEQLGEPYTCTRERVELPNPIQRSGDEESSQTVTLWRWTVEHRGETVEMLTPPGPAR